MLDASAFTGPWPFQDTTENTPARLIRDLTQAGLAGAALSPADAILHPEPMAANLRLLDALHACGQDFLRVAVPVIDPSLPTWREHVDRCVAAGRGLVAGFKIVPNYQAYSIAEGFVDQLAEVLTERRLALCVQARMSDERGHHPLMKVPPVPPAEIAALAGRHPDLRVLVCGAYMSELGAYAKAPNVGVEMSMVESGRTLQQALQVMGPDRLLIGTHAPLLYPAAGLARAWADDLDDETRRKLTELNFRKVFDR